MKYFARVITAAAGRNQYGERVYQEQIEMVKTNEIDRFNYRKHYDRRFHESEVAKYIIQMKYNDVSDKVIEIPYDYEFQQLEKHIIYDLCYEKKGKVYLMNYYLVKKILDWYLWIGQNANDFDKKLSAMFFEDFQQPKSTSELEFLVKKSEKEIMERYIVDSVHRSYSQGK